MRVCSQVFSYSTTLGAQDVSRNGASAALANIHGYLPHLFHSEDLIAVVWEYKIKINKVKPNHNLRSKIVCSS